MKRVNGQLVYRDLFVPREVLCFQMADEALEHPGRIDAFLPLEEAGEFDQENVLWRISGDHGSVGRTDGITPSLLHLEGRQDFGRHVDARAP